MAGTDRAAPCRRPGQEAARSGRLHGNLRARPAFRRTPGDEEHVVVQERRGVVGMWGCPVFSDSEQWNSSFSLVVYFGFKADWTAIGKAGVQSGAVIEGFDVVEDGGASFGTGGEALMVNQFVFEAAQKRFDNGVGRSSCRGDSWRQ